MLEHGIWDNLCAQAEVPSYWLQDTVTPFEERVVVMLPSVGSKNHPLFTRGVTWLEVSYQ